MKVSIELQACDESPPAIRRIIRDSQDCVDARFFWVALRAGWTVERIMWAGSRQNGAAVVERMIERDLMRRGII